MNADTGTRGSVRRYSISVTVAFVITLALVAIMRLAVHLEEPRLDEAPRAMLPTFVPQIEDIEPGPKIKKPEPPPPVLIPPPALQPHVSTMGDPPIVPPVVAPPATAGPSFGDPDGDMVPILTSAPQYPARALARAIEGWVLVEFSVDTVGRVSDPRVLAAEPTGVFDRAALNAVVRYKYKPRVRDGAPTPVHGVRQRIVFSVAM